MEDAPGTKVAPVHDALGSYPGGQYVSCNAFQLSARQKELVEDKADDLMRSLTGLVVSHHASFYLVFARQPGYSHGAGLRAVRSAPP